MSWVIRFGLSILLVIGLSSPVAAQGGHAPPLVIPVGPGPRPERTARLDTAERVERAHAALRARGYDEFPVLAWALLEKAQEEGGSRELIARALALAPNTPSVRFEAAWALHSPMEFARALLAFPASLPALLWLITLLAAAAGVGAGVAAAAIVLVAAARSLPLHAHRLGHLIHAQEPPVWPGVLLALSMLALLARLGLGPVLLLGAAGALATTSMRFKEGSSGVTASLVVLGLLAGPLMGQWSRLVTVTGHERGLLAAWRIDRGSQPLPDDRQRLEQEFAAQPEDPFLRLALATAWLREGGFTRADQLLREAPPDMSASLRARAANLRGIIHLARGRVEPAITAFERARSADEGAGILYNLSQAHGRGLNLLSQASYFKLARQLDAGLIQARTLDESSSVHRYLIRTPIPWSSYLSHGLRQSAAAEEVAVESRRWLLGAHAPGWAWLAVPTVGLLGFFFGGSRVRRCTHCLRPICLRCWSMAANEPSCGRCAQRAATDRLSDAEQAGLERELARRRRLAKLLAAVSLLLPGIFRIHDGRVKRGAFRAFLAATGVALLFLADALPITVAFAIPAPFEVGGLGVTVLVIAALVLIAPLYTRGALEWARHRIAERRPA